MMKLLLFVFVVAIAVFVFASRRRRDDGARPAMPKEDMRAHAAVEEAVPAPMIACVHCGVHLPKSEAKADAEGRLFCSTAHRLAGPRAE
jgi:uncharacterized protein